MKNKTMSWIYNAPMQTIMLQIAVSRMLDKQQTYIAHWMAKNEEKIIYKYQIYDCIDK